MDFTRASVLAEGQPQMEKSMALPVRCRELATPPTARLWAGQRRVLLGIQMMFSFMLVDDAKPLKLCKQCQRVFLSNRSNAEFCSPRCKNQHKVYKSRSKSEVSEE